MKHFTHTSLAISASLLLGAAAIAQTTTQTMTTEQASKVKAFVMKDRKASTKVTEMLAVGTALPANVEFYALPADAAVANYRYTIVNDKTILVDPSNRKIVHIVQ